MNYELREMLPEDGAQVLLNFRRRNCRWVMQLLTKKFLLGNIGTKIILSACRFVAEDDNNNVVAWAALKPVSNRECFSGVAEVSIYITNSAQGKGLGKVLLQN